MTELYPVFFATVVIVILSALEILFFRLLNRSWWNNRWLRRGSFLLPLCGLMAIVVWTIGLFAYNRTVALAGSFVTATVLILILALLLSLPVSGVFNLAHDFLEKRSRGCLKGSRESVPKPEMPVRSLPRRAFLKAAAAVVPVASISSGVSGVAYAFTGVRVYKRNLFYPDLPSELEGLRILHISDIHIGYYVWLEHIEQLLELARSYSPDIVVATGDLSDRLDLYGDMLRLLDQFRAPLGVYASIGNHEYFRGINRVLKIFDSSPVPLLLNTGVTLRYNGFPIFLAGADDPRYLSRRGSGFFRQTIDEAVSSASSDSFSILLSHRPEGFDYASEIGLDLTLAGHTHGAQLGFAGRSILEPVMPEKYLWGQYRRDRSQLYTSAGVGHWFPFRLGCPAEAPVLELTGVSG